MKKKLWIIGISLFLLLAVLFVPIPKGQMKDGGTKVYDALTYKIVKWNRITDDSVYSATRVYWFPENQKSLEELWEEESRDIVHTFTAKVVELSGDYVLVEPFADQHEWYSSDRISFSCKGFPDIGAQVGSVIEVGYTGGIMESYPAQVRAVQWEMVTMTRQE